MGFRITGFQQDLGHMSSVPQELSLLICYIWELSQMTSEDLWVPKLQSDLFGWIHSNKGKLTTHSIMSSYTSSLPNGSHLSSLIEIHNTLVHTFPKTCLLGENSAGKRECSQNSLQISPWISSQSCQGHNQLQTWLERIYLRFSCIVNGKRELTAGQMTVKINISSKCQKT